ncbi:hypothetical protein [Dokdonia sp. Asnod3-C12]|uniref:hypothetical protein n=1 Tax=Dokdonia sp. Asnod3-C12 TaxID=3160575 RepID=UPI0038667B2F
MKKSLFLIGLILVVFASCSTDITETELITENNNSVITEKNLIDLKTTALKEFEENSYNLIFEYNKDLDFNRISKKIDSQENNVYSINLKSLEANELESQYLLQMNMLYNFGSSLINSNLFEENTTLENRKIYVEEILIDLFKNHYISKANNSIRSSCGPSYRRCLEHAETAHAIRMGGCVAAAVISGVVSGGIGSIVFVPCAVSSGLLFENDRSYCSDSHCDR